MSAALDDDRFEEATPQVRPDALIRRYDNEAVAWSSGAARSVHLDPVAWVVYQLLDGSATIADLISDVHEVLEVPHEVARNRLRHVIDELDRGDLLVGSAHDVVDPAELDIFPGLPNR